MDSQNMNPTPVYVPQREEMSVGAWIGTLILTCIPIVNIICLIVWAVGSSESKRARKNWAIAQLIIMVIGIVLVWLLVAVIGVSLASMY